jgi:hypothetical protein
MGQSEIDRKSLLETLKQRDPLDGINVGVRIILEWKVEMKYMRAWIFKEHVFSNLRKRIVLS